MARRSTAAKIGSLRARREALLAQIERERVAFARAWDDVGPLLRLADRVASLGVALRSHPLVLGAGYLSRALWWNSRPARWLRRGRMLIRLLRAR